MRQVLTLMLFGIMAIGLNACHCKTCSVSLPGGCCDPCPKPPKPLKPPKAKKTCELPLWPDRPVKCVTTKVCRKCCHYECCVTEEGYPYKIEVCEITYKSLYTDGSSKIWTEVSRNPVTKTPSGMKKSKVPMKGSIVGDRCDSDNCVLPAKIQHMDKHIGKSVGQIIQKVKG